MSGVSFLEAWEDRMDDTFDGVAVSYMGLATFIRNERASGRKKDLADLEMLGEE